ncbi:MAG: endonuclease/exonuclease/phosphatase family protein [Patescibacteria group bacterium]|nr:endonuclease/exonuclease/phosphatase family protein [Patescibacteria group bacterium]
MNIKIASINLQSGVATTRGFWHYALTGWKYWLPHSNRPIKACGDFLKKENIDIACVNEISESSLMTGWRSQTETLSDATNMKHTHFFSTAVPFKKLRDEGNAILSVHPITSTASHPLHKELFNCSLDEAVISVQGKSITVLTTHLALTKKHRDIQIREIIELVKVKTGPIILSGDFNEPDPAAFDELRAVTPLKQLCTLPTFPSWKPTKSLDYIFLSEEFNQVGPMTRSDLGLGQTYNSNPVFSDHVPLVVEVELI